MIDRVNQRKKKRARIFCCGTQLVSYIMKVAMTMKLRTRKRLPAGVCRDSGVKQRNNRRGKISLSPFSREQKRHQFLFACSVFLVSLWLCMFGDEHVFICRSVVADEPMMTSTSSSSFLSFSSSVIKSKARIVAPSSCSGEDDIEDLNQSELTDSVGCSDAFFLGEGRNPCKNSRKTSHLFSTPAIRLHRNSRSNTVGDESCEQPYGNDLQMKLGSLVASPSRAAFKKTGTTIAGCVVQGIDGGRGPYVILAADTRATEGTIVADKRCDKIHKLSSNCRCCGAGTSADLDKVTRQVQYQMALQELQYSSIGNGNINDVAGKGSSAGKELLYPEHRSEEITVGIEPLLWMHPVSIDALCNIFQEVLFQNGGQLGANLIVGGVWNNKAYLRAIHPHGSTDVDLPFTALGSGGLAAMAVLEQGYQPSLTLEEGIDLVQRSILSGIRNDLGSGSQVDLCVIDPDGVCRQTRGVIREEELLPDDRKNNASDDSSNRTNRLLELLRPGDQSEDDDRNENGRGDANGKTKNLGVNGFGNQPFAIETSKQRMVSVEIDQAKKNEMWDRFLGF